MILGLDIATSTGWCMGTGAEAPALGSITMPSTGEEVGPFLEFFERWFQGKLETLIQAAAAAGTKPLVVFEAPMLPKARFDRAAGKLIPAPTNITTTRKLQSLSGLCELLCHKRQVPVREEFLQSVKSGLAGKGNADKLDMMRAAKRAGMNPANFDEADAFGVWLVGGVRKYAKKHAPMWDRIMAGGVA